VTPEAKPGPFEAKHDGDPAIAEAKQVVGDEQWIEGARISVW
jgi:hypothetical protein